MVRAAGCRPGWPTPARGACMKPPPRSLYNFGSMETGLVILGLVYVGLSVWAIVSLFSRGSRSRG